MRSLLHICFVFCTFTGVLARCPFPYEPWVHGRCLVASPAGILYADAVGACAVENGVLASIHSEDDNAKIAKAMSGYRYHVFLGLQCNRMTNTFQWIDGTPLDYTNFRNPPNGCIATPQVTFDPKTGFWTAYSNAGYNSYLCEYPHDDEYPCDGYEYLESAKACVRRYEFLVSWMEAEAMCQDIDPNSHLISIHSDEGNDEIADYAMRNGFTRGIHIGLRKQNGSLAWSDGTSFDYSNFLPGMPIDTYGTCVAQQAKTSQWTNVQCETTDVLPFLCTSPAFVPKSTIQPPGCPDASNLAAQGDIYSPGYPLVLNTAGQICDYLIYGDEGRQVSIAFDVFELNSCCDSLEIYEGTSSTEPIAVLTGEFGYEVHTSAENVMRLRLRVGDGVGVRGFHGTLNSIS